MILCPIFSKLGLHYFIQYNRLRLNVLSLLGFTYLFRLQVMECPPDNTSRLIGTQFFFAVYNICDSCCAFQRSVTLQPLFQVPDNANSLKILKSRWFFYLLRFDIRIFSSDSKWSSNSGWFWGKIKSSILSLSRCNGTRYLIKDRRFIEPSLAFSACRLRCIDRFASPSLGYD